VSSDAIFVFALTVIAGLLMASNRIRYDAVALLVVLTLMLSGVLSVGESLSGFGSPVVVLVVCLLIVGEMLARTGVAAAVGDWILQRGGKSERRLLVLIMLAAGILGAVMSSTAIVAIFIPIILRIASDTGLNASRLLLPMSYAALISGMLTLIATTPNIVVHEELKAAGYEGFGFFGFTIIGAIVLVAAIVYILFIGRRLLPGEESTESSGSAKRSVFDLWRTFNTTDDFCRARMLPSSSLVGQANAQAHIEERYGVRLVGIEPEKSRSTSIVPPASGARYSVNDVLLLVGSDGGLAKAIEELDLTRLERSAETRKRFLWDFGGASVLVHPDSTLVGKTVREADFFTRFRLQVIGLRHGREPVEDYAGTPLKSGDSLFVLGPWSRIKRLAERNHEFVVLELPSEIGDVAPERSKMPVALAILVGMVILMMADVIPLTAAVMIATMMAVATRCLSLEEAYRSVHWSSIVLIAGMLPLADAMAVTGGTQMIVDALLDLSGDAGPYAMLTLVFFLTATLGLILSNTASAVLVAPVAIYVARALEVSPYPFALAVLIAASAAYSTPVSTPVVTLVVDPGRYRFADFLKVGIPLLMLTWLVTLAVTPLVFPF
jgi:di/tricarboxylate transporter